MVMDGWSLDESSLSIGRVKLHWLGIYLITSKPNACYISDHMSTTGYSDLHIGKGCVPSFRKHM